MASPLAAMLDPEEVLEESCSPSDSESSADDVEDERSLRRRSFVVPGLFAAGGALMLGAGALVYVTQRSDRLELGPWSEAAAAIEPDGIRMVGSAAQAGPREMYASVFASPPFCNASQKVLAVHAPRKLDMPDEWLTKCEDYTKVQSDGAWGWPGRNYCWDRVKGAACYGETADEPLKNWWWAQEAAWRAGRGVPHPNDVPMHGLVNPALCDFPQFGKHTEGVTDAEKTEATKFIQDNVDIFTVNLPKSVDRWNAMQGKLRFLGLNITRIPGVDLTEEGGMQKAQEEGLIPKDWSYGVAKSHVYELMKYTKHDNEQLILDDWMGIGTVGCAAAHMRAQLVAKSIAMQNLKPMALILEDDIEFQDDFSVKLHRLITREAPCDWQVVALTSRCAYGECVGKHLTRVMPDGNEPDANCHGGVNYGMYGQLYRVSEMQDVHDKLWTRIWNHSNVACVPVDIAMSRISDEIAYYAVPMSQSPGLITEGTGPSDRLGVNGDLDTAVRKKPKGYKPGR